MIFLPPLPRKFNFQEEVHLPITSEWVLKAFYLKDQRIRKLSLKVIPEFSLSETFNFSF